MASIEDILVMKAMEDQGPSLEQLAAAGMLTGGTIGALGGQGAHAIGNQINRGKDALAARQGLSRSGGQQFRSRLKPGNRMAGGLAGAIMGGLLGAGVQQLAMQESEAARLLAKGQLGQLTQYDMAKLEKILTEAYDSQTRQGVA